MVGGSYGGQIQFATAAYEHEHGTNRLDAIVPMITWNDLSYSLDPNNSGLPGGHGAQRFGELERPRRLQVPVVACSSPVRASPTALQDIRPLASDPATASGTTSTTTAPTSPPGLHRADRGRPRRATRARPRSPSCGTRRWPATCSDIGSRPCSRRARPTPCSTCRSRWPPTRAQGAGHAGRAGLAVVGPQPLHPGRRRARRAAPAGLLPGPAAAWPGSTTTSSAPRTAAAAGLPVLPRLGLRRPPHDITKAYAVAPAFPVGRRADVLPLRLRHRRRRPLLGNRPPAAATWSPAGEPVVAGHQRVQPAPRRSARTTRETSARGVHRSARSRRSPTRRAARSGSSRRALTSATERRRLPTADRPAVRRRRRCHAGRGPGRRSWSSSRRSTTSARTARWSSRTG